MARRSAEQRFWEKVDKTARPDGCWLWTASTTPDGAGQFRYVDRPIRAHRISYMWAKSVDLTRIEDIEIFQTCDNRLCVNPAHLSAKPTRLGRTSEERFWEKVDKSGPIHPSLGTPCWQWTAGTAKGYGVFYPSLGAKILAHRFAYEDITGHAIPDQIDHRCHNHGCVNPAHLRLATNKQNEENRQGMQRNNTSGVRGVHWASREQRWRAQLQHNGKQFIVGYFTTKKEAEAAVIVKRNELFTHNDADR